MLILLWSVSPAHYFWRIAMYPWSTWFKNGVIWKILKNSGWGYDPLEARATKPGEWLLYVLHICNWGNISYWGWENAHLVYKGGNNAEILMAYTDSNWAADLAMHWSTTGYFALLASSIICWQSHLQKKQSLSHPLKPNIWPCLTHVDK